MSVCVRACVHICACACVHVCVNLDNRNTEKHLKKNHLQFEWMQTSSVQRNSWGLMT